MSTNLKGWSLKLLLLVLPRLCSSLVQYLYGGGCWWESRSRLLLLTLLTDTEVISLFLLRCPLLGSAVLVIGVSLTVEYDLLHVVAELSQCHWREQKCILNWNAIYGHNCWQCGIVVASRSWVQLELVWVGSRDNASAFVPGRCRDGKSEYWANDNAHLRSRFVANLFVGSACKAGIICEHCWSEFPTRHLSIWILEAFAKRFQFRCVIVLLCVIQLCLLM
jgi:hypothetical protein